MPTRQERAPQVAVLCDAEKSHAERTILDVTEAIEQPLAASSRNSTFIGRDSGVSGKSPFSLKHRHAILDDGHDAFVMAIRKTNGLMKECLAVEAELIVWKWFTAEQREPPGEYSFLTGVGVSVRR